MEFDVYVSSHLRVSIYITVIGADTAALVGVNDSSWAVFERLSDDIGARTAVIL